MIDLIWGKERINCLFSNSELISLDWYFRILTNNIYKKYQYLYSLNRFTKIKIILPTKFEEKPIFLKNPTLNIFTEYNFIQSETSKVLN